MKVCWLKSEVFVELKDLLYRAIRKKGLPFYLPTDTDPTNND